MPDARGDGGQRSAKGTSRGPKPVRKVTPEYLERAALHYLERFASSSANLRRVLLRKVQRSAAAHGTDPAEGAAWVEALLARYAASGLLDDTAYAEMKAAGLHRRGDSQRLIRQKLAAKGVAAPQIAATLERMEEDSDKGAELEAAVTYARRRRLGSFRSGDRQPADAGSAAARARFDKDLAAMARAGFDLATARCVLEAEDPHTLLDGERE